jgi:hypothetical protein
LERLADRLLLAARRGSMAEEAETQRLCALRRSPVCCAPSMRKDAAEVFLRRVAAARAA